MIRRVKEFLLRDNALLALAFILMITYFTWELDYFFTKVNSITILQYSAVTFISGAGFAIVLIGGGLDLSVGSAMMVVGVVTGKIFLAGVPLPLCLVIGLSVGITIGFINGLLVSKARINPLIVTLGMMFVLRGIGFDLVNGRHTRIRDDGYRWARERIGGVPVVVYILFAVALISIAMLRYTKLGRLIYAVGGNPEAARQAAINVDRFRLGLYTLAGLYFGFAGIILGSMLGAVAPNSGTGRELVIATAVFLGGASLKGGKGSVAGTLIGVLFVTSLANGVTQMQIIPEVVMVLNGVLLIAAVAFDQRPKGGYR